jgi:TatA/E family protein of Tat protein translocase
VISTIFSGTNDLIVILVAFVVLFGGSQLPKLAHNTGEALREFRKAHSEVEQATAASVVTPAADHAPATSLPMAARDEVTGNSVEAPGHKVP